MRSHRALLDEEQNPFGPGTDLVLSLVAVLVLLLFVVGSVVARQAAALRAARDGDLEIAAVRAQQRELIERLAAAFRVEPVVLGPGRFSIPVEGERRSAILINNEVTLQSFRFGSQILFAEDRHELKSKGRAVLRVFGTVLIGKLPHLAEVQIQGHADPRPTRRHESNLHLAAKRAIAVYRFLDGLGIDPAEHLVSATSYGEFKPVARGDGAQYSAELLQSHNATEEQMDLNRRIEVRLIYRRGL